MDPENFRCYGKEIIEIVAQYWESLRKRLPISKTEPGFMNKLIAKEPPNSPQAWEDIFNDIEAVVFRENTHWHHPNFHAFYPTACSYQSIIGDILSGGLSSIGFTWKSSPPMTELELHMMDWLAKGFGLPDEFLNFHDGPGGGIIHSTASEASFIALVAARAFAVDKIKHTKIEKTVADEETEINDKWTSYFHDPSVISRLVAYTSDQAHSSIEKAAMLAAVRLRKLKSTRGGPFDNFIISTEALNAAIEEDRSNGLVPFILIANVGTTSTCAIDPVEQLGPICKKEGIWLHIDSAYAGPFSISPKYRFVYKGAEYADSINANVHKTLLINFDCSPTWFKNAKTIIKYFNVDPEYLKYKHQPSATDLRHLQVALGRRFRSLKIWFVLRNIGIAKLREYVENMSDLAAYFEKLVEDDELLQLFVPRTLGLVCFELKGSSSKMNKRLADILDTDNRIFLSSSNVHGRHFLRLVICSQLTTEDDIRRAYSIIHEYASKVSQNRSPGS